MIKLKLIHEVYSPTVGDDGYFLNEEETWSEVIQLDERQLDEYLEDFIYSSVSKLPEDCSKICLYTDVDTDHPVNNKQLSLHLIDTNKKAQSLWSKAIRKRYGVSVNIQ
jgi:hypothetical protein